MLQALKKFARIFSRDENQLSLELLPPRHPTTSEELEGELRRLGLPANYRVRLTRNRTVVVSYGRGELRVHRGFREAPEDILRAIVAFVQGRTRAARNVARRKILAFPVDRATREPRARTPHRTHAEDLPVVRRLAEFHAKFNAEKFEGKLQAISIGISRRMKSRLGHYSPASGELPAEIVISRRHFRRHGWDETLQTLLHEMVHQWQAETGRPIDHGAEFRQMARAVGIAPHATRRVA